MIPLNINFLKSQPTVGELRKLTSEALQSPIKLQSEITRGDEFVARPENKISANESVKVLKHSSFMESPHSLMPRTFNYTKLNTARRNLEWEQAEKELGLIQL